MYVLWIYVSSIPYICTCRLYPYKLFPWARQGRAVTCGDVRHRVGWWRQRAALSPSWSLLLVGGGGGEEGWQQQSHMALSRQQWYPQNGAPGQGGEPLCSYLRWLTLSILKYLTKTNLFIRKSAWENAIAFFQVLPCMNFFLRSATADNCELREIACCFQCDVWCSSFICCCPDHLFCVWSGSIDLPYCCWGTRCKGFCSKERTHYGIEQKSEEPTEMWSSAKMPWEIVQKLSEDKQQSTFIHKLGNSFRIPYPSCTVLLSGGLCHARKC